MPSALDVLGVGAAILAICGACIGLALLARCAVQQDQCAQMLRCVDKGVSRATCDTLYPRCSPSRLQRD